MVNLNQIFYIEHDVGYQRAAGIQQGSSLCQDAEAGPQSSLADLEVRVAAGERAAARKQHKRVGVERADGGEEREAREDRRLREAPRHREEARANDIVD